MTQGRAPSHGGTAARSVTSTPLLEFAATADFHFRQPNASAEAAQHGRGGERFFTTSEQFANRALAANPGQFRILSTRRQVRALARERWAHTYYAGKRVLFLLPSQALGSNVATLLFLQAFIERHAPGEIGVFCARAAVDIFRTSDAVTVYPLWIERRELASWNVVIDLGQLESRRDIEVCPVDMEADLLEAFELEPARRYGPDARPFVQGDGARIGILPLASSPLRTLPPAVTEALCAALAPRGAVTLCLNRNQHQGVLYRQVLAGRLADHVEIIDAFDSIAELLAAIESFDYAVLADSGPAHMTKLFVTPGVAVFTSAPGEVLQGRFTNLARWTVPFAGPHCRAPCGLAKLRQTVDGRVGCMGSLGVALDVLPEVPRRRDDALTERLLLAEPVPCVGALAADPTPLVDFVIADIDRRAGQGR